MSPSRIYHRPDSPLHGVHQCVDLSHWDVIPLFQQCCSQLPESAGGVPTSSYAPVQFVNTNAQLGTNLDCTVASRVVQCCCLPESLGKLWLHEDGNYHAGKSFDAVSLMETRPDEGSHLCILPLSPLPHWKATRSLCCHPSHTTRATCPIDWQTDVRTTSS